jgi:hypothetical protein
LNILEFPSILSLESQFTSHSLSTHLLANHLTPANIPLSAILSHSYLLLQS